MLHVLAAVKQCAPVSSATCGLSHGDSQLHLSCKAATAARALLGPAESSDTGGQLRPGVKNVGKMHVYEGFHEAVASGAVAPEITPEFRDMSGMFGEICSCAPGLHSGPLLLTRTPLHDMLLGTCGPSVDQASCLAECHV